MQLLLLAAHEEVLTPGHKADQGLGVEPPQLGVGALLAADAIQEAVELQLGAARRGLAGHAQLGGRGGGDPFALQAFAAPQPWCGAQVATAFGRFLQRLRSGKDVLVAAAGARGVAKVGVLMDTHISLRVAEVQLGTCCSGLGGALGPEEAIRGRGRPTHELLLGKRRGLQGVSGGYILSGARREGDRSKELLSAVGGRLSWLRRWT